MIKRSRGGWIVVERVPPTREGKRIRKWVATLRAAADLLEPEGAPTPVPEDLGPTLKEFSETFLRRHEPARKDPRTYKSNVKIVLDYLGEETRLGEITIPKIIDMTIARQEKDGVAGYTTNRQVATISTLFNCARAWGVYSGPNPCRGIKLAPEADARDRVYTSDEIKRILEVAVADLPFYAMLLTALYCGLRKGSLRTLRWDDIRDDFVIVRRENSKGKKREHRVPVHPDLREVLDRLDRRGPYVFEIDGTPFTGDMIDTRWARCVSKAKIVDPRGSRFHDLRRTFGTSAMKRGLGTGMVQKLLGHRFAATTERYLHADQESLAETTPFLGPPRSGEAQRPSDTGGQRPDEKSDDVSSEPTGIASKRRR